MKIKNFLLISLLLSGIFVSCKDDDDDNDTITDDPRIRTMSISKLSSATFIVNDTEALIFNYDSLSYGTNISRLHPTFAGYGGTMTFSYLANGEWKEFSTSDTSQTFNFSAGPQRFKAIASDPAYTKEYNVEIRVHQYDVEAITWEKSANALPLGGETLKSYKAVFHNQKYYFFYQNEAGESYVITSDNGENWSNPTGISILNPDWRTLTSMLQTLAVQAEDGLYICNSLETFSFSNETTLPENCTLQIPLFTLGNNFWIIAKETDSGAYYLCSLSEQGYNETGEFQKQTRLSSEMPVKEMITFTAPSGSTTLGYIVGENGTQSGVWGMDTEGNVMKLTSGQSVFPSNTSLMPLSFQHNLYMVGGKTADKYSNRFYVSQNSGSSWSNDSHKILPDSLAGGFMHAYDRSKIILIGGENKDGFQPHIWRGTLNLEILENRMQN